MPEFPSIETIKKQDVCEHGNPKDLCDICNPKTPEKNIQKKEKLDYSNPSHLKEILSDPGSAIDLEKCGVNEFGKTIFGANTRFGKIAGVTLLRKFGEKNVKTENMIALLEFTGFKYKKEKLDYSSSVHLREILSDPELEINFEECKLGEFSRVRFGENTRFGKINGSALLRNFGNKGENTENMITLLNFAGFKREYAKKEPIDYSNPEHLGEILSDPGSAIDLEKCVLEEFSQTGFGENTRFGNKTGLTLLRNFGDKRHCVENMIALLRFAGIDRTDPYADEKKQRELRNNLEKFAQEIIEGKTAEAQNFHKIINLLGSSDAIDILYKFRPEFRDMPVERVKGIIADYLGEFLLNQSRFNIEELEIGKEYLSNDNWKEALVLNIKRDALAYLHKTIKDTKDKSEQEIIAEYIANIKVKASNIKDENIDEAVQKVEMYYHSIFSMKKPANFVDSLKEGRIFPDLNQLINIKEIQENQRMLIADEMGLGKSASAIMAKEYLGLKCGVIVAPSNVISTWQRYLSSERDENGKQIGYFKEGLEPKILVIESPDDLEKLNQPYDYLLISQEKLNDTYTNGLKKIDYDMLIIDEIHKLKNLEEGVRSKNMVDLAEKNAGSKEKYLALLSGTPVPNKVEDLAIILKLLYPEEFKDTENKDLVHSMIYSEVVDLRNKLLPRMQMKSIRESIEMPALKESVVEIELSPEEKSFYEILWEEDELTASEKLQILRKFLLNPEMLKTTPITEKSKMRVFEQELQKSFETKEKVICFFNGYIENVIRGDKSIINDLNLPEIEIRVIEGDVPRDEREAIQKELGEKGKKILLLVSGQTADVGVDFSGAEKVYFYNNPWSKYDKRQQLGRVYREGLEKELESTTLIVKNTIEEGIEKYINAKERAIEKLLHGIPRTEIENRLIEQDEKQKGKNLEINAELAEYYFTKWDRMMRIFAAVKEMGEKDFVKFLSRYGQEYADCYTELGSRTYQGNNSRAVASLLDQMMKEKGEKPEDLKILDIASGPEMLKQHSPEEFHKNIFSLDINEYHFKNLNKNLKGNQIVSSFLNLPIRNSSIDYCNLALALHYTKFQINKGIYERLQVLAEMNRVLKKGGQAVISMIYSQSLKEEAFEDLINKIGFKIIKEYSGDALSGDNYKSTIVTLEKINDIEEYKPSGGTDNANNVDPLARKLGRDVLKGLKFDENKSRIKDSRQIIKKFHLGDKEMEILFNKHDAEILAEEDAIKAKVLGLKIKYGDIENIPSEEIINNGFSRIIPGKNCILFKKLSKGEGAVVLRENIRSKK